MSDKMVVESVVAQTVNKTKERLQQEAEAEETLLASKVEAWKAKVKAEWTALIESRLEKDGYTIESLGAVVRKLDMTLRLLHEKFPRLVAFSPNKLRVQTEGLHALVPGRQKTDRAKARYLLWLFARLVEDRQMMRPGSWIERARRQLRFAEGVLWGMGVPLEQIMTMDQSAESYGRQLSDAQRSGLTQVAGVLQQLWTCVVMHTGLVL